MATKKKFKNEAAREADRVAQKKRFTPGTPEAKALDVEAQKRFGDPTFAATKERLAGESKERRSERKKQEKKKTAKRETEQKRINESVKQTKGTEEPSPVNKLETRKQEEVKEKVSIGGSILKSLHKQASKTTIIAGVDINVPVELKVAAATFVLSAAGPGLVGGTIVAVSKGILAVVGLTATTSGIMTWLASDNMLQSMELYTRDIKNEVISGDVSPEEALVKIEEGEEFVEKAVDFIEINTQRNPLLWPFRNLILSNAARAKLVLANNKETIIKTGEGEKKQTFEEQKAESRQLQLEQREKDSEYFRLIREGKFEEAEELLQSQLNA